MRARQLILNIVLAPLVILLSVLLVKKWIENKPPPRSRKPVQVVPRVAIIESRAGEHSPTIATFGNVQAYNRSEVASQVGGRIVSVSEQFQAGRSVKFDDILLTIDSADFLAEIERQKAALATAQRVLAEEESRSKIAREDWIASGRRMQDAPPFTLRAPQLAAATADVAASTAALTKAELDLARTEVTAPFAAVVQGRTASPGNVVTPGTILGTLIARERVEVRLPLTPEQAARLNLPPSFAAGPITHAGLTATVTTPSQPEASWTATITRTEPSIDPANQVLFVVAEIAAPFKGPDAFLPIGAFVNATLTATPIPAAHRLPESALVEDRYVWILAADDTLLKQPVERLYSAEGFFLARISEPRADPLRVATRPLVSFAEGDPAEPLDPDAPPGPPGGRGKGKAPRAEK